MRLTHGKDDFTAIRPSEARLSDTASLQREMKWSMDDINTQAKLEGPALALCVFLTFRKNGRLISYARAEELLDEIEFVPESTDVPATATPEPEEAAGPTSAPTGSDRGDALEPEPGPDLA